MALLLGSVTAPHAHAQTGINDVTFWDDSPTPTSPNIPQVPNSGFHFLKPTGGRTPDDGLLTIVGESRYQIVRDRDRQIDKQPLNGGTVMWLVGVALDGTKLCIGAAIVGAVCSRLVTCAVDVPVSSAAGGCL